MKNSSWPTYADVWLLLLRIGVTATMLTHGIPKLNKVIAGNFEFGNPIGIGEPASLIFATFAEVVCSVLVLLGLWTRLTVIPLAFTMLVTIFFVHISDPFGKKELPLLYLFIYTTLFIFGSGKYSLDATLGNKRRR
ncbi:DoxX family protein [Spirosoma daeguense]